MGDRNIMDYWYTDDVNDDCFPERHKSKVSYVQKDTRLQKIGAVIL